MLEQAARTADREQKTAQAARKQAEERQAQRKQLQKEVTRLGRELREARVTVFSARRLVARLWEPDDLLPDDLKRYNRVMGTRHRAGDYM